MFGELHDMPPGHTQYFMNYPKELFELNFAFVYKVSEILGKPWPDLLLNYTHTFRRFRLGAEIDPLNPTWLQFLDHQWRVRPDLAGAFLERVGKAQTMDDLERAFPYAILTANAEIETFYAFYEE